VAVSDDTPVFKALADTTRRRLLDRLRQKDGSSLGELVEGFAMSRYGIMKHLRILEEAGLVIKRRDGRRTRHFLNPVPIRQIHDRWISRYAAPWVGGLVQMKQIIEEDQMNDQLRHVYEIYIRTTPVRLWEAITSGEMTHRYFHKTRVESEWKVGSKVIYTSSEGAVAVEGEVRACNPPRELEYTWNVKYDPERSGEQPSIVRWEIEKVDDCCRLTLLHSFAEKSETYRAVKGGWNEILSSMKSLLETGKPLSVAGGGE
jgi:DNA-binding transcriptional ArsR family regulator